MTPIGNGLERHVLETIRDAYLAGKLRRTKDCVADMLRDGLYEADLEKVIMEATEIVKVMPATSLLASSPHNTHYVIRGSSTRNIAIYCKACSNYHPRTNEFVEWRLTSFSHKEGERT